MLHAGRAKIMEAKLSQTRAFLSLLSDVELRWLRDQDPEVIADFTSDANDVVQQLQKIVTAINRVPEGRPVA